MSKITSNGNVKVVWILEPDLANPDSPTAAELNDDGLDISSAIAFDGYELGATDSDDIEDRALTDLGSAITRGFANYAASLPLFADADQTDASSIYNDAKDAFKVGLTNGYLVSRVAKDADLPFAAGDRVSVFKFQNGIPSVDGSGDTVKLVVEFLPQGFLVTNTLVATAAPVVTTPPTITSAVGDVDVLSSTVGGQTVTHSASYSSSDSTVASVSQLGVVTSNAAGTATITISHDGATAPDTVAVTVS